ncbi:hypothetical protein [Sodaliphilus sp.]|uniref:hypothetical protein n=1 Tax=Sodaliphilus sp. TaxID=2815818 RepID=UPI003890943A
MKKILLYTLATLCLALASCDRTCTTKVMLVNQSDSTITVYQGDKPVANGQSLQAPKVKTATFYSPIAPRTDKFFFVSESKGFKYPWDTFAALLKDNRAITLRTGNTPIDIDLLNENTYTVVDVSNDSYTVLLTVTNEHFKTK